MTIYPIPKDIRFDLIHVGKCGGSSAAEVAKAHGYQFNHIHLKKPIYKPDKYYIILVRDPISRFISAYNWRKYLYEENLIQVPNEPAAKLRHATEQSIFRIFPTANTFAESLMPREGFDVSPELTLMNMIGHVPQGFSWYLRDLLDKIDHTQLLGVVCQENFLEDMNKIFGIHIDKIKFINKSTYCSKDLSKSALNNLQCIFSHEYDILKRAADLMIASGKQPSVNYSLLN